MPRFVNYNPDGPISYMVSPGPPGLPPGVITPGSSPVMMLGLPPPPPVSYAGVKRGNEDISQAPPPNFIRGGEDLRYQMPPPEQRYRIGPQEPAPRPPSLLFQGDAYIGPNVVAPDRYLVPPIVSPEQRLGTELRKTFTQNIPTPNDGFTRYMEGFQTPRAGVTGEPQYGKQMKLVNLLGLPPLPDIGARAPAPVVVTPPTPRRPLVDTSISEIQKLVDDGDALFDREMGDILRERNPLVTEADLGDSFASLNDAADELAGELKDFSREYNKMGKKLVGIGPSPRLGPGVAAPVVEPPDAVHTPEEAAAALDQEKILDEKERVDWYDKMSHPLSNEWVQKLPGIPFEKKPGEACMIDCKERQRVKELECDEIRRRVITKLKEVGCPTRAIPIKESIGCNIKK